jgi:putative DNA primase/helicase
MTDDVIGAAIVRRVEVAVVKSPKRTRQVEAAKVKAKANGHAPPLTEKPLLRIAGGKLIELATKAAKALGAATLADPFTGIYRRGNLLVRPARLQEESELGRNKIKRPLGQLVILEVDLDYLVVALSQCISWEKFDKRSEKWLPSDPPLTVARALKAAHDRMRSIPYLAGIIEAPTLRRDGSVLDQPGYDRETGLVFDPGTTVFPPVPERPTRAQAEAALERLKALLDEFVFVDEASKAVTIASYITAVIRKGMRTAPLLGQSATMMSSGKTLLDMIAGYIATGREPPMMSQAENASEDRKRLLAMLVEGAPVNVIDNVEDPLRSATLAAILTASRYKDRWLGVSKNVTAPTDVTFLVNGNNLVIEGDLSTRTVKSSLDPGTERPEEKHFNLNLHEYVPANRGQLAVDCITIVRAYIAAGEPLRGTITNYARFEDWSRRVREPLIWLDMADVCETRKGIEENDPKRSELIQLLTAWNENYPGEGATVGEAIKLATGEPYHSRGQPEPAADTERRQRLADALREVSDKKGGGSDGQAVGHFIRANEGTRRNGMRFVKVGVSHNVARWKVEHERGD